MSAPASPADAMPLETGPQLLQRLGMNAEKWCAEMVARGIVNANPTPGELFHAWMCNAIMNAHDIGFAAGERRTETERLLPLLKQAILLPRPWMTGNEIGFDEWEKAVTAVCDMIDHLTPPKETKS